MEAPGAVNHLREALGFDWFQQVSDGIGLKRRQRVLIVTGCEDDQRQRHVLGQRLQNLEAVQPGISTSRKTRSGRRPEIFSSASSPSRASPITPTTDECAVSMRESRARADGSSSIIRLFIILHLHVAFGAPQGNSIVTRLPPPSPCSKRIFAWPE